MIWNVMIDGHTLEFKDSSGIDPWTEQYCKECNIPLQITNNIETYARLDMNWIYRMDSGALENFKIFYEDGTIKDFHDILSFLFNWGQLEKTMDQIIPLYGRKTDENSNERRD